MELPGNHALYASCMGILVGVAGLVDYLEMLLARGDLRPGGVFEWSVLRTAYLWPFDALRRSLDVLLEPPTYRFLLAGGAAGSLALVALVMTSRTTTLVVLVLLLVRVLLHLRNQYGLDGADQMQVIVLAGLLGYYATDRADLKVISLGFVGAQSLLSYLTAGAAKAGSEQWRSGQAMSGILQTSSYGSLRVARLLQACPRLARAVCWYVIALECIGPAACLAHPMGTRVFVFNALLFHIGVALLMGLNVFLWAFAAALVGAVFLSAALQGILGIVPV